MSRQRSRFGTGSAPDVVGTSRATGGAATSDEAAVEGLSSRARAAVKDAGESFMAVPPVSMSPLPPVLGDPSGLLASAIGVRDQLAGLAGINPAGDDVAVLLAAAPALEEARSLLELVSGRVASALEDGGACAGYTGHTVPSYLAQSPR